MNDSVITDEVRSVLKAFASRGGKAVKKKYGKSHFAELGRKGMEKRWGKKSSTPSKRK